MTEQRYRPPADEQDEFWRRLREVMNWALQEVLADGGPAIATAVAEQLDSGRWRVMTRDHVDSTGQPDVETLFFRVEVEWYGGTWVELCEARWTALGVSPESAAEEARAATWQNGLGIPDDLSGLTEPPS